MITVGQRKGEHIYQMMAKTNIVLIKKYLIESYLGLDQPVSVLSHYPNDIVISNLINFVV
jgi:hypothetical protein